jgi:hypothetical protein
MATPAPRRRKSAEATISDTVKSSLQVSRDLHSRWQAAASLRGMTANAFAVEALRVALRGIVVIDKNRVKTVDRPGQGSELSSDDMEAA